MSTVVIPTPNLDLVLQTPEEALAWVETLSPEDRAEVSEVWLERARATKPGDYWALGFRVVERATGVTVGGCAFKGPPDAEGSVEIAYGIDEAYRCRGFATESASALAQFAWADERVHLVLAHTRSDNEASARVLAKCGFRFIGPVLDPEDGPVDRWGQNPV